MDVVAEVQRLQELERTHESLRDDLSEAVSDLEIERDLFKECQDASHKLEDEVYRLRQAQEQAARDISQSVRAEVQREIAAAKAETAAVEQRLQSLSAEFSACRDYTFQLQQVLEQERAASAANKEVLEKLRSVL